MNTRVGLAAAAIGCVGLVSVVPVVGAQGGTGPCAVVPRSDIVAALGSKLGGPAPMVSSVGPVTTCTYSKGSLTISVGPTTIADPALPLSVVTVPGLPNGTYRTYRDSVQTEIIFFKGTASSGTYGVVRGLVAIKRRKLEAIALALYAGVESGQAGGATTTPSVSLVSG